MPQGSGTPVFAFSQAFGRQGVYNGSVYQQTFIQRATIVETGGQRYATTAHTCPDLVVARGESPCRD